jgi:hypothetical protein
MAQYAFTFTSGDTVTPTKLNDARTVSEIVDADIKSDAAIAGTKIAPNFGSQNVVTTGESLVGHSSGITTSFAAGGTSGIPKLQVAGPNLANSSIGLFNYSIVGSSCGQVLLSKSTSNVTGSHVAVSSGNRLGEIGFIGSDGTNFVPAALIKGEVDGTPGTNDMPGRLVFSTTADGASSPTERMRITNAGNVGIANTSPTEKLHVTGNIKASGFIDADTSFRGQATDSASAPSYCWTGDTNTGMFRPASNTIAFATNGGERARINSSGNLLVGTTAELTITSTTTGGFSFKTADNALHASRSAGAVLNLQRTTSNGASVFFFRDTTNVGNISVTTTATAFNTSSDYRLKQNVEPMVGGLAKLAQLKPSTFEFKSEPTVKVDGFIAHEVQAVVPQAVTGEKDGEEMQGLDHSKLVPVLVAAVQELSAKVAALEAA